MSWGDVWNFAKDPADSITGGGFGGIGNSIGLGDDATVAANAATRPLRQEQGAASGAFAGTAEQQFGNLGRESQGVRDALWRQARGKDSISAEQLRQGLQQQQAMQQSMAASARPANAAMAARTAAMQAGRNSSGMAGQQAVAGLAERQQANQMLGQMLQQQRQLELQASLGGRQNAINAYAPETEGTPKGDKILGAGAGVLGAIFSDRRLKKNIEDGDADADAFLKGLKAYRFDYKSGKHGKGTQLGIMAQDLEKSGLGKQAVIDTPKGKMVHGAKLATALAAATSTLHRRIEKLEAGK